MSTTSRRNVALTALFLSGLAVSGALWGEGVEPVAVESRVDEPTPFKIREPAVAIVGGQRPFVAWTNDRFGILGRFLDTATQGDFTLVANSAFPSNPGSGDVVTRQHPSIVSLPGGDFLLLWTEERALLRASIFYYEFETYGRDIFAQRFDTNAAPIGEAFRVNEASESFQSHPRAVVLDGARLAVTWETESAVWARVIDINGSYGPEIRVNQTRASQISRPALARAPSGDVMLTWTGRDDSGSGVFARLFDSDLRPLTDEVVVNSNTRRHQKLPSITASRTGGFLIAWQGRTDEPREWRIFTRLVGADGVPTGSDRLVSGEYGDADNAATVVTCLDGRYLVLWLNWIHPFATFVGGVELDAGGRPMSDIFQINSERPQQQWRLDAAVAGDGSVLVTWEGFADRKKLGVSARRLEGPAGLQVLRAVN